jgi:hypothetical protein
MYVTVLSVTPIKSVGLMPAPNVTDSEHIAASCNGHQTPVVTDLMAAPILILDNYRSWNLYCAGGVTVYRVSPVSEGGHGYAGSPIPGTTEEVNISCSTGHYKCTVRFE